MLISVHVPKTAGTAFRTRLERHFGDRLLLDYADRPLAPGHLWRRFANPAPSVARLAGFACVHGHFIADKYDHLGARARLVSWLRDPVQRVASHYHYWKRVPDPRNPDCRRLVQERLDLEAFAALPRMRNVASRFFGRYRPADFFFLGIVEEMAESQRRLRQLVGIEWDDATDNRNDDATGGYALPATARARIAALNANDCRLYDEARALFERGAP
ncbi:hypothetical protein FHW12_002708 [Dokdonella fugitiva]|uniref:Sulfotransferase family protein n=1 Tax=Dokdonella fugitiva TaxID=328517 RepID=A0A839EXI3_9GAMM|nr:hypothetical protein [Dokdonella fugitiva]MBA8888475.1 hypothetical protein [Dokdonella fugitiva]